MQRNLRTPTCFGPCRISICGIVWGTLVFFFFSLFSSAQASLPPPAEFAPLNLGSPFDRAISGRNVDGYEVSLEAGQYAGISVQQRGIDVIVAVLNEKGEVLAEFDSESRVPGQEHVLITAESASRRHVTVRPKYPRATEGVYQIQIDEIRAATGQDRVLFEAHKLSTEGQKLNVAAKYGEALGVARRALESGEKALAPNDPYLGELMVKLGDLEKLQDNLAKAISLFEHAIALDQAALGRENPQTALALQRLGVVYNSTGEYDKAEPLFQESLAITEKTLGNDHPRIVVSLMNMANLHVNRSAYDQALAELQRALAIAEKQLDVTDFSFIAVVNNLGDLYVSMTKYDEAEPLTERAIEMIEKTRGRDYPRLAEPLMNLAIIAREKKQYARALELLDRSKALREKAYGPRNSEVAACLITIGNVHRAEGEFQKAVESYQQARDILETAAGPYHYLTLLTYVNAAIAYAALGDINQALAYQTRSDSILEKSIDLNLAIGSEHEKSQFLSEAAERTDRTISVNALLAPNNAAATDLASLVLLQRKGRLLDAMSGSMAALRERMSSTDQKLLDELNVATAKLAKLALNGAGKMPPEEYEKQLASLGKERERLEAEISRRSGEFRTQAQSVTLAAVKSSIPEKAALIEFASYRPYDPKADSNVRAYGEPHYIVYVLRKDGGVQWKEIGPAKAIDAEVTALRAALRDPGRTDVQLLARTLDEKVMQPVRSLTGDATQLLISPDGELNLVPFEALVDEQQNYLVERYSINYLTTGRDLLRLQVARASRSGPMIVADPIYGEPVETAALQAPRLRSSSRVGSKLAARRSVTTADDLSGVYFSPLAGTALEASAIKSAFPEARLLTGRQATESAIKKIDGPSILHIATHGFFLADPAEKDANQYPTKGYRGVQASANAENPLLRSGLALAGANLSHTGPEKGILTALEASTLNLWGTKLVTLSACDTGVGQIRNGEGVYGLRRAFVLAGAESVVMSLWPVSDYATREMMSSYYKGLRKGLGRGEALRQTKLAMLKRKDRHHPFYWASFIQSGEWANLKGKR
jgi:CHAT domain-containing protein/lipopolysaccharide biosynthesis regulator YciM